MNEPSERGLQVFGELLGKDRADALRSAASSTAFGSTFARLAVDFVFDDIWSRDGLSRRDRSLVTIGALVALRQTDEIDNHTRIALNNGLTANEIEEALLHLLPYAGFPAVASATAVAAKVLNDQQSATVGGAHRTDGA